MNSVDEVKDQLINLMTDQIDGKKYDDLDPTIDGDNYMKHSPFVVGYGSTAEQQFMFENLLIGFDSERNSILDIGCGRADLYGFLQTKNKIITSYQGIDHNPLMADIAKNKYNIDIKSNTFETADLPKADWVVASGFFTPRRCETEDKDLEKLFEDIDKMYNLANTCISFNLLSPIGNKIETGFFYVHPGLIMDMLIEKYQYVTVRNNYTNDVYTVTIYKY